MQFFEMQRLLNETVRDQQYEVFRAKTFTAGLRVLRAKQRHVIWPKRLAIAAVVAFMLGLGFLQFHRRSKSMREASQDTAFSFVSRPLEAKQVVRSRKDGKVLVETRKNGQEVEIVETAPVALVELNDQELLAIFGDRPAGLVRNGNKAELLILGN